MIALASVVGLWIALAAMVTFCLCHAASRPFDAEADLLRP